MAARHTYTVDEPEDEVPDVTSDRSTSIDGSESVKFSMAEMEVYLQVLQQDRYAPRTQPRLSAVLRCVTKHVACKTSLVQEYKNELLCSVCDVHEVVRCAIAGN
jgi:hypothetical protein